jgi:hypothetical protein
MNSGNSYKKITDYASFDENPFMDNAVNDIRVIKKTQIVRPKNSSEIQQIVAQGGEVTGYSAFMRFIEVDEERFAKVYLNQFASFWDLPNTAIRVFGYVINTIKPKQDTFTFDLEDCLSYTKYKTKKSVFEGLSALIECIIIARGNRHYKYFINPLVVFNGDRVAFTKMYVKKKKDKEKPGINQLDLFQEDMLRFEEQDYKDIG